MEAKHKFETGEKVLLSFGTRSPKDEVEVKKQTYAFIDRETDLDDEERKKRLSYTVLSKDGQEYKNIDEALLQRKE